MTAALRFAKEGAGEIAPVQRPSRVLPTPSPNPTVLIMTRNSAGVATSTGLGITANEKQGTITT